MVGVTIGTDASNVKAHFKNVTKDKAEISNKNEITCMEWVDQSCSQMLVGYKNKVKLYDSSSTDFVNETSSTDQCVCGVFKDARYNCREVNCGQSYWKS